jgi:hypothetical protein
LKRLVFPAFLFIEKLKFLDELTMISVTISEPLAQAAISQAKVCHRTIDSQIDHWAKIGKIAEENPDLSFEFINAALQGRNEVLTGKTEPYSFD